MKSEIKNTKYETDCGLRQQAAVVLNDPAYAGEVKDPVVLHGILRRLRFSG